MTFEESTAFAEPISDALSTAATALRLLGMTDLTRVIAASACKLAIDQHGPGGIEQLRTAIDQWESRVVLGRKP